LDLAHKRGQGTRRHEYLRTRAGRPTVSHTHPYSRGLRPGPGSVDSKVRSPPHRTKGPRDGEKGRHPDQGGDAQTRRAGRRPASRPLGPQGPSTQTRTARTQALPCYLGPPSRQAGQDPHAPSWERAHDRTPARRTWTPRAGVGTLGMSYDRVISVGLESHTGVASPRHSFLERWGAPAVHDPPVPGVPRERLPKDHTTAGARWQGQGPRRPAPAGTQTAGLLDSHRTR
jgi:hypothetical protein